MKGSEYEKLAIHTDRPRCKDGSLDMRFAVNRGLDKYGNYPSTQEQGPKSHQLNESVKACIDEIEDTIESLVNSFYDKLDEKQSSKVS